MLSVFSLFITEVIAYRWGTAKLKAAGIGHGMFISLVSIEPQDAYHTFSVPHPHEHPPGPIEEKRADGSQEEEANPYTITDEIVVDESAIAQIIGVAILEFGVVLHR
jgi:zinc transporter 1/2/3